VGRGRKDLRARFYRAKRNVFVENFSRISGCGVVVKEAKTVGSGGTQVVLILETHKLRWHVHRRHDGWSSGCVAGRG